MPTRKRRAEAYRRASKLVPYLSRPQDLNTELMVGRLQRLVRTNGLSWEKIGISKTELSRCLAAYRIELAKRHLEEIRRSSPRAADSDLVAATAYLLQRMLLEGTVTPESIGITENELVSLGVIKGRDLVAV